MTIEIHRPELEALIRERMESGAFQSVEDVLMEALRSGADRAPSAAANGEPVARASRRQPVRFRPVPIMGEPLSHTILRDREPR